MTWTLHIDIETFSDVDLRKAGLHKYVQSPNFQILLFAYAWGDQPPQIVDLASGETLPAEVITALADPQVIKCAHNAAFETTSLSKYWHTSPEQWYCTMVHAYYCRLPGSLGALSTALELPKDKAKDRIGSQLIRYFCVPCKPTKANGHRTRNLPRHDPERWELFKVYCLQDVVAEQAVMDKLSSWSVPPREWEHWVLDQQINRTGVHLDQELISAALEIAADSREELMSEAVKLSGLDNPNSNQQLKQWLEAETDEQIDSVSKEQIKQLLTTATDDRVRRMLEIRQELGKASISKYQAMHEAMCSDGRARGLMQFYGTGTGRWAGRRIQPQNLPRNNIPMLELARSYTKAKKPEAISLIWGSVPDTLSQLIRTAIIPSPGCRFIVADFSAIEARVIAWLAKEQWRQDVFATTGKIYEASASQMFGVPVEKISKGNPEYELRQKGKVAELALGYQGSTAALIAMGALKMGLSEDELPDIVKRWRAASPRIVDLWYSIERCAVECVRSCQMQSSHGVVFRMEPGKIGAALTVELPAGRKLFFLNPELLPNQWGNDQVVFWSTVGKGWGRVPTYGGKLAENTVQAIARDCLAESMQRLAAAGYQTVMHIHDEVVLDVPNDFGSLQEVCDILGQPIDWAPGLLLKAAGFETDFYQKD